jgi:hypothetical protein
LTRSFDGLPLLLILIDNILFLSVKKRQKCTNFVMVGLGINDAYAVVVNIVTFATELGLAPFFNQLHQNSIILMQLMGSV